MHRIHCEIASLIVSTSAATSIALIVTEAVTNSIKYAHPHGAGGSIKITLERVGDNGKLTVTDDGKGLPDDFDSKGAKTSSLGTRLIKTLSASVGSEATFKSEGEGTIVTVSGIRPAAM